MFTAWRRTIHLLVGDILLAVSTIPRIILVYFNIMELNLG